MSALRLYGVAIWFAIVALARLLVEASTAGTVIFGLVTSVLVVVAERERQRLVRERRRPYRDE